MSQNIHEFEGAYAMDHISVQIDKNDKFDYLLILFYMCTWYNI